MATIYDVADKAGVSPKTAARILAGKSARVKNREKVLQAARQLGYVRNQHAANLRSGRTNMIGFIVPDIANPTYPKLFQTMHREALLAGYQILLFSTAGQAAGEISALQACELNRVDGIILIAAEGEPDLACDEILQRLIQRGCPVVVGGRKARNLPVDEIVLHNTKAVEKAVAYLIRTGHQKIAFITGQDNLASQERQAGYEKALRKAGRSIDRRLISGGQFTAESGEEQVTKLLAENPDLTAIMAANDFLAIGAMKAIRNAGKAVGHDVAVIGVDDIPLALLVDPPLTTLRQPYNRMALDTITRLLARINDTLEEQEKEPCRLAYDMELIIRESA
jgi:DNA-binding LacI/PurR family transcriptional regulator